MVWVWGCTSLNLFKSQASGYRRIHLRCAFCDDMFVDIALEFGVSAFRFFPVLVVARSILQGVSASSSHAALPPNFPSSLSTVNHNPISI